METRMKKGSCKTGHLYLNSLNRHMLTTLSILKLLYMMKITDDMFVRFNGIIYRQTSREPVIGDLVIDQKSGTQGVCDWVGNGIVVIKELDEWKEAFCIENCRCLGFTIEFENYN